MTPAEDSVRGRSRTRPRSAPQSPGPHIPDGSENERHSLTPRGGPSHTEFSPLADAAATVRFERDDSPRKERHRTTRASSKDRLLSPTRSSDGDE